MVVNSQIWQSALNTSQQSIQPWCKKKWSVANRCQSQLLHRHYPAILSTGISFYNSSTSPIVQAILAATHYWEKLMRSSFNTDTCGANILLYLQGTEHWSTSSPNRLPWESQHPVDSENVVILADGHSEPRPVFWFFLRSIFKTNSPIEIQQLLHQQRKFSWEAQSILFADLHDLKTH